MRYINHSLKSNDINLDVVTEIRKGNLGSKYTIDYIESVDNNIRHGSFLYGSIGLRDSDFEIIKNKCIDMKLNIIKE